jgi:uncharacterized protein (TIGR02246 family)
MEPDTAKGESRSLETPARDEVAVQGLLSELVQAWNRSDAQAYGALFRIDGTFTNVNGSFFLGQVDFIRRHEEIFRGDLKGTTLAMAIRDLRFVRPDVAVVDVETSLAGMPKRPPSVHGDFDGIAHSCLLMVLVKDEGSWSIAAYHNVWQADPI